MLKISVFIYDCNISHDMPKDYSVDEHYYNGNNDDLETELPEVSIDSGT
jgi:hypothetical protein